MLGPQRGERQQDFLDPKVVVHADDARVQDVGGGAVDSLAGEDFRGDAQRADAVPAGRGQEFANGGAVPHRDRVHQHVQPAIGDCVAEGGLLRLPRRGHVRHRLLGDRQGPSHARLLEGRLAAPADAERHGAERAALGAALRRARLLANGARAKRLLAHGAGPAGDGGRGGAVGAGLERHVFLVEKAEGFFLVRVRNRQKKTPVRTKNGRRRPLGL